MSERKSIRSSPVRSKAVTGKSWQERREVLRARLQAQWLGGLDADEVEAHFAGMPAHYWEQVTEADLFWGLETIHGFLKLVTAPDQPATKPVVVWREDARARRTRVMLATWDRHGLLAKAAAAFSAVGLSIVEAEAYMRADNIVLISFSIADGEKGGPGDEEQLKQMLFLLEGALSQPPRLVSELMCTRHKFLVPPGQVATRIVFETRPSAKAAVVQVEAPDRLGLLCDVLQTLADDGLDITYAEVRTEKQVARDTFRIQEGGGRKGFGTERLAQLRRKLEAAIANEAAAAGQ